jgi:ABC-type Fe3+ transport system permease subunit
MASLKKLEVMDSIRVVNAPEPADVLWENLHYSPLQRVVRAIWVYIVSIFLIGISFGAIIGLTYLQKSLKNKYKNKSDSSYNETGYSILISIIITIINFMITLCLNKLSE